MSRRNDIFKAFIKYGDETEDRVKNGNPNVLFDVLDTYVSLFRLKAI